MKYQTLYRNNPMAYMLAKKLQRQVVEADKPLVFFTVNLLGQAMSDGHVCLDLQQYLGQQALVQSGIDFVFPESLNDWQSRLEAYDFCQGESAYLRFFAGRLYLAKYAKLEAKLVEKLLALATGGSDKKISNTISANNIDWQQVAVVNSVLKPLSIIVGGPGTGKTTTVVKVLQAILQAENRDDYRVLMAAPTGKAATRLAEAVNEKLQESELPDNLKHCVQETASTLHRLLGYSQTKRTFYYNQEQPLAVDCLLLDEVSMIDLAMFSRVLDAVPKNCRVILLGDAYQLASVEAGNVLAEICDTDSVQYISKAWQKLLPLPDAYCKEGLSPLADNITLLRKSYRFSNDKGIGKLAHVLLQQDVKRLPEVLQEPELFQYAPLQHESSEAFFNLAFKHHQHLAGQKTVEQALAAMGEFQLLCATKNGPASVEFFTQQFFSKIPPEAYAHGQPIYQGMAVMMMQNNYSLQLFNGDLGIIWPEGDTLYLFFKQGNALLKFLPSQLPGWQVAHAITVHKSQGSEYQKVALALPPLHSPLLGLEMFYTAVTRAKSEFHCLATMAQMQKAVTQKNLRHSGIQQRLQSL